MKLVSKYIGVAAVLGIMAAACSKSGEDTQKKKDEAQLQLTQAQMEANQQVDKAQATADQKMAVASADFRKSVADYRTTREKDLADVDKQIADLTAKQSAATGTKKATIDAALPDIRTQRDALARQIRMLDNISPMAFDSTKANIDKTYDDLKTALRKAS